MLHSCRQVLLTSGFQDHMVAGKLGLSTGDFLAVDRSGKTGVPVLEEDIVRSDFESREDEQRREERPRHSRVPRYSLHHHLWIMACSCKSWFRQCRPRRRLKRHCMLSCNLRLRLRLQLQFLKSMAMVVRETGVLVLEEDIVRSDSEREE
ncbi:hypothetical protein Taro_023924 [Colocasia esculenta]|uniref:Uncharacterized protein n=1 Tax=Colocasia esculenta TaxID=4460 RepID=A0A843VCW9_COLES|nr:hypothetical protein [Colocasia esculenta]